MKTAHGNAPMKFIRLEAVAQVMNWTTGFKRSVNCWPNRSTPLAPGNGRQQPATEATPALRGRLGRRTMNAASYNRATDLKERRIRVNAVSPGSTDTPGLSQLLASTDSGQQRLKMISNTVPLGRLGTPDEIAKAVVFLASDDASYITGTELFVDGGFAQV